MPADQVIAAIRTLEVEMKSAARALEFEQAAHLRDEIQRLKQVLPDPELLESVTPKTQSYMTRRGQPQGQPPRRGARGR